MNINWKGHSCFEISASPEKGGAVTILIDPFGDGIGLKLPRKMEADIVLTTHNHPGHSNIKALSNSPFVIDCPGEYDIKDVYIKGISAFHDNSQGKEYGRTAIYTIETEGLKLCHLGDLGQKELTTDQLEAIGDIDILMIPVGGTETIDARDAMKIMEQIEPRITIPMHFKTAGSNAKISGIEDFLKSLGVKSLQPEPKLSIKKKDILPEEAKIVLLEC
jgi:L-ascorbate metabolism protein UlaG (beta-lactamase superfamily)